MKKKIQTESSSTERRKTLEKDVDAFLKAGNQIQYIDDGVSAQDPQGKGRPLRLGSSKDEAAKPSTDTVEQPKK
ncbi:MAG: hypothetical protein VYE04_17595 [Pseudomonadota bacterium]|nr:hypothetical protein [Pseudomonadota bacterium]